MKSRLFTLVLGLALLVTAETSFAKTLTVSCKADQGGTVDIVTELANINSPPVLKSFAVNQVQQSQVQDTSKTPVYNNGQISLKVAFGKMLYNSVTVKVKDCTDSFLASGTGEFSKYVGGFMGSEKSPLTCTCELK